MSPNESATRSRERICLALTLGGVRIRRKILEQFKKSGRLADEESHPYFKSSFLVNHG